MAWFQDSLDDRTVPRGSLPFNQGWGRCLVAARAPVSTDVTGERLLRRSTPEPAPSAESPTAPCALSVPRGC